MSTRASIASPSVHPQEFESPPAAGSAFAGRTPAPERATQRPLEATRPRGTYDRVCAAPRLRVHDPADLVASSPRVLPDRLREGAVRLTVSATTSGRRRRKRRMERKRERRTLTPTPERTIQRREADTCRLPSDPPPRVLAGNSQTFAGDARRTNTAPRMQGTPVAQINGGGPLVRPSSPHRRLLIRSRRVGRDGRVQSASSTRLRIVHRSRAHQDVDGWRDAGGFVCREAEEDVGRRVVVSAPSGGEVE